MHSLKRSRTLSHLLCLTLCLGLTAAFAEKNAFVFSGQIFNSGSTTLHFESESQVAIYKYDIEGSAPTRSVATWRKTETGVELATGGEITEFLVEMRTDRNEAIHDVILTSSEPEREVYRLIVLATEESLTGKYQYFERGVVTWDIVLLPKGGVSSTRRFPGGQTEKSSGGWSFACATRTLEVMEGGHPGPSRDEFKVLGNALIDSAGRTFTKTTRFYYRK